jgi:hypothetical protein
MIVIESKFEFEVYNIPNEEEKTKYIKDKVSKLP